MQCALPAVAATDELYPGNFAFSPRLFMIPPFTISNTKMPDASHISILYVGCNSGTSRHRALSLGRLGYKVRIVDPYTFLPSGRLTDYWVHHTGAFALENYIRARVLAAVRSAEFDLVWVNTGDLICPELVRDLKQQATCVLNYNNDDPFGTRDKNKWRLYLRSVPFYDLVVVVRDCNVTEAYKMGAIDVLRVHMSSDEVVHAPRKLSPGDCAKWQSEVAFIGTWLPERGPFMAYLVQHGVPLSIWGDRWSKADEWPILKPHWRGPGLYDDDSYAMAVQCAKVCIGMLSKGNRDLCTQRSFEIPQLGGLLCAERTPEHLSLYRQDVEAVFWSDAGECVEQCKRLLSDDVWRSQVARNGQLRSTRNATTNEAIVKQILARAFNSVNEEEALVVK
jgi:spore maturation protein CgeB